MSIEIQKIQDRQYLAFVSRRLKQIANKTEDADLKSSLWTYSKEILDISSRIEVSDTTEFIGNIVQSK